MFGDSNEPTQDNVGKFIPTRLLLEWHEGMKKKFPQVYTPDDQLFGTQGKQHFFGTKLKTFFDDDPNKPMQCEVVGSRWDIGFGMKEPMYVILMDNDSELSQIPLTSAHEEGGWQIVEGGPESDDDDDENSNVENSDDVEEEPIQDPSSRVSKGISGQKHCIEPSISFDTIQNIIHEAGTNDVIEFSSGTFGGDTSGQVLEITKNLHISGQGMDETVLNCNLVVKQDGCSGGKVAIHRLKVQGIVKVTANTFEEVAFVSVEVNPGITNSDAVSIDCCKKLLLFCCEIVGGSDGLSLLDHSTRAKIEQTDINLAASRGIFANPSFEIKDSAVYNCGGYGIKGRSGWSDLGGNDLQPGPWSSFGGPTGF